MLLVLVNTLVSTVYIIMSRLTEWLLNVVKNKIVFRHIEERLGEFFCWHLDSLTVHVNAYDSRHGFSICVYVCV